MASQAVSRLMSRETERLLQSRHVGFFLAMGYLVAMKWHIAFVCMAYSLSLVGLLPMPSIRPPHPSLGLLPLGVVLEDA